MAATSKASNKNDPATLAWAAPFPGGADLMQANAAAATIWFENWAKLAREGSDFMTKRWAKDLDLWQRSMACKDPMELVKLQTEFLQRAFVDYADEASAVMDMETEAGIAEIEAIDRGVRKASA
ncbi:MAG: hypothetical protein Kilf2KO_06020 [Rhodospirillales bacterium]